MTHSGPGFTEGCEETAKPARTASAAAPHCSPGRGRRNGLSLVAIAIPTGIRVPAETKEKAQMAPSARAVGMDEIVGAGKLLGDDHAPGVDDEFAGLGRVQCGKVGVDPVEAHI